MTSSFSPEDILLHLMYIEETHIMLFSVTAYETELPPEVHKGVQGLGDSSFGP